jgi:hypothetical protein
MALTSSHVGVIDSRYHKPEALEMRDRQLAIYISRTPWNLEEAESEHITQHD